MPNVTKRNIAQQISETTGITQKEILYCIDSLFDEIAEILKNADSIKIRGFGTFKSRVKRARPARDFLRGKTITLEERIVPQFRFHEKLKEVVNQGNKTGEIIEIFDVPF